MKKIYLLLVVLMMSALHAKAQDIGACLLGTNAEGKKCWVCVNRGSAVENLEQTYYNVEINVLSCEDMFSKVSLNLLGTFSMLIRQEEGKTFRYDEEKGCEVVLMDITLEEGDVFVRPNGEQLMVERTETDADGIKIIHLRGIDSDTEDTWRSDIGSVKSGILQVDDIEGIIINCYQDNFTWVSDSGRTKYYYPEVNNDDLKQVSYLTPNIGSGSDMDIDFSFVDDSLHIKGIYSFCGDGSSMQIIQCIIDRNNIYILIDANKNYAPWGHWGYDQYYYDLKIPGFKLGIYSIYAMYVPGGKGMQAICGDVDYRPFIEEGKVWKVGEINVANPVYETSCLHYYYFDGDTIIGGVKCKKMMCHDVAKEMYPLSDGTLEATCYVGAMYEQQKKVYIFKPDEKEPLLLYDFGLEPDETEYVAAGGYSSDVCEIKGTSKEYVNNANYKGNYLAWTVFDSYREEWNESDLHGWMEGVGFIVEPIYNGVEEMISPRIMNLMSCTVGDEVIYYNPDIIDGVNPPDEETKKRIDFTHIQKPRPKAPRQEAEAEGNQLSGAYTLRLLDLDLGTMSDTYLVTITDDTGETVYNKTIRAADVLALNIDISKWTAPSYTINVENDYEQYIGTFELIPTDIEEVKSEELKVKTNAVYDLTGRCLTCEPKKGMYIKDGRKYLKR